jgi:hypothetical protein
VRATCVRAHGDGVADLVDRCDSARLKVVGRAAISHRTKLFPARGEREAAAPHRPAWAGGVGVRLRRLVPVCGGIRREALEIGDVADVFDADDQ